MDGLVSLSTCCLHLGFLECYGVDDTWEVWCVVPHPDDINFDTDDPAGIHLMESVLLKDATFE
jgi:hypothetical protein